MPNYLPGKDRFGDGGFGAGGGGGSPFAKGARGASGIGGYRGASPGGVPQFSPNSGAVYRPYSPPPASSSKYDPYGFSPSQLPSKGNINRRIIDGLNSPRLRSQVPRGDQTKLNQEIANRALEKSKLDRDIRNRIVDAARDRYRRSRIQDRGRLPSPTPTPVPNPIPSPSNPGRNGASASPLYPGGIGRRLPRPVDRRNADGSRYRPRRESDAGLCSIFGICAPGIRQQLPIRRKDIPGGNIAGRRYFCTIYVQTIQLTSSGKKELFVNPAFQSVLIGKLDNLREVRVGGSTQIRIDSEIGLAGSSVKDNLLAGIVDFPPFVEYVGFWISLVPLNPLPGTVTPPFPGDEGGYDRYADPPFSPIPLLVPPDVIPAIPHPLPLPSGVPVPEAQPWFPAQPVPLPNPSPYPTPVSQPVPSSPSRADAPDSYLEKSFRTDPALATGLAPFPVSPGTPFNNPIPPPPCPPGCVASVMNCISVEPKFALLDVPVFGGCHVLSGEPLRMMMAVQVLDGTQSSVLEIYESLFRLESEKCAVASGDLVEPNMEFIGGGVSTLEDGVYFSPMQNREAIGYRLIIDAYDKSYVRGYKPVAGSSPELGLGNVGIVDSDDSYVGARIDVFQLRTMIPATGIRYKHRVRVSLRAGTAFGLYRLTMG